MTTITKEDAQTMILNAGSRIFSLIYTKKDGAKRTLTGRLHVKRGVKGTGMAYSPLAKGLLPMFDLQIKNEDGSRGAFRMVNLCTVEKLVMAGTEYEVI